MPFNAAQVQTLLGPGPTLGLDSCPRTARPPRSLPAWAPLSHQGGLKTPKSEKLSPAPGPGGGSTAAVPDAWPRSAGFTAPEGQLPRGLSSWARPAPPAPQLLHRRLSRPVLGGCSGRVDGKHLSLGGSRPGSAPSRCLSSGFAQTPCGGGVSTASALSYQGQRITGGGGRFKKRVTAVPGLRPARLAHNGPVCAPGPVGARDHRRGVEAERGSGEGGPRALTCRREPPRPAVVGRGERCGEALRAGLQGKVWKPDTNAMFYLLNHLVSAVETDPELPTPGSLGAEGARLLLAFQTRKS